MLEGLASWVLKTYIGKYVNVNPDKLSIGLLSGVVELENASLKLDALNENPRFPFEIKFGHIGKIKLNISLNTLRYSPWSLVAENVHIIIGPRVNRKSTNDSTYNSSNFDTEKDLNEKLDRLNNLENKWFKEIELLGINDGSNDLNKSKFVSYIAPVAYSLLNNLQVSFNGLHIRYEDEFIGFSVGANIDTILIKNDPKSTSNENDQLSFKLFELINFSLYTNKDIIFGQNSSDNSENLINSMILKNFNNDHKVDFLIQPTTFQAQLIRDLSSRPIRKRKNPRIRINTVLKDFNLILCQTQVEYFTHIVKSLNIYANRVAMLSVSIPLNPQETNKGRFKYLAKCVLCRLERKLNWDEFKKWSKDVKLYKTFHENLLNSRLDLEKNPNSILVNGNDPLLQEKERIEREWTYNRLLALRRTIFENFINKPAYKDHLIKLKLENEQLMSNQSSSYLNVYGYLSWRLGNVKDYYFKKTPTEQQQQPPEQLEPEHNKIDDEVIGLINDTLENDTLFKRDSLLAVLEFKLENASVLLSSPKTDLIKFKFENSLLTFEALPRHDSFQIEINLGSFFLYDCYSSSSSLFSALVYPKPIQNNDKTTTTSSPKPSVFNLIYEHKPLNKLLKTSSNLIIKSCGLDIVYCKDVLEKMIDYLKEVSEYSKQANSVKFDFNGSRKSLTSIAQPAFESSVHNINFDFEITAPKIILPQNYYSKNPYVFIFDFGQLTFLNRNLAKQKDMATDSKSKRRNSDSNLLSNFKVDCKNPLEDMVDSKSDDDDDQDDVFATPMATPPNENEEKSTLEQFDKGKIFDDSVLDMKRCQENVDNLKLNSYESFSSLKTNLYSNYDLSLSELQVICGKFVADNLTYFADKGHSKFHLLEKFDINVQLSLCKLNNKTAATLPVVELNGYNENWPAVKINISVNLLKLNIDDSKITNLYKMLNNLKSIFKKQNTNTLNNEIEPVNKPSFYISDNLGIDHLQSFMVFDLKLNEVDVTMSITHCAESILQQDKEEQFDQKQVQPKSLCELKIYLINSTIVVNKRFDLKFKLSLFNMLLIDARQIYGIDYQLLAASHNNILLDTETGIIINRLTGLQEDLTKNEQPLIVIDLDFKSEGNDRQLCLDTSFSTLDIVLNPETISELCIFGHSIYLNISATNTSGDIMFKQPSTDPLSTEDSSSESKNEESNAALKSNIKFRFNRLSVLMFQIEDEDLGKARKIALLALEGVSVEANILPELKYLDIVSKIEGLNISDLSKNDAKNNFVFGIGLHDRENQNKTLRSNSFSSLSEYNSEPKIFELIYKKYIEHEQSSESESKELTMKIASLCYLHSPKLIHDIQLCFKDFMRFHARIMEEVTEKATNLAMSMLKKGQTYLKNTLAELYKHDAVPKAAKEHKSVPSIKIKMLLETPVISIPINISCRNFLVAHLGQIKIKNETATLLEAGQKGLKNEEAADSTKFKILLKDMNLFSVDSKIEEEFVAKQKLLNNLTQSTNSISSFRNNFYIFYKPNKHQNLIENTDVTINLDYLPTFVGSECSKNNKLNGGCLNLITKITNTCQINLSKQNIEQFIQTLDNIIYVEKKNLIAEPKAVEKSPSFLVKRQQKASISQSSSFPDQLGSTFFDMNHFKSSSDSESDETSHSRFKYPNLDLTIRIQFKIEKLGISFLADVDKPLQEIAELCFNQYELNINKEKPMLTSIRMTLKSLYLIDKLIEETKISSSAYGNTSASSAYGNSYLLWTNSNVAGKHTCKHFNRNFSIESLSFSAPSLNRMANKRYVGRKYRKNPQKNKDILNNMFELTHIYNQLSTSLPSELSNTFSLRKKSETFKGESPIKKRESATKQNINENNNSKEPDGQQPVPNNDLICPSTPPPSPTGDKKTPFFKKCESVSSIVETTNNLKNIEKYNTENECKVCVNQSNPLVKINILLVDDNHPDLSTKYNNMHKYFDIKFSRLKLNVNPETWIILLELLGLGSKIYPTPDPNELEIQKLKQMNLETNTSENVEVDEEAVKSNTGIKFKVEQFTIQLNENQSNKKSAKLKINQVKAFIEAREECVKAKGQLGSLIILDASEHRGLYSDRFLTTGRQALEFEFLKYNGPLAINEIKNDFESSLKLKMSSFKYVHTQRFVISLANYFQQFNQLQDSLGKMRAISIGLKNISYEAQRSSRVKLNIKGEAPIIVIPLNSRSKEVLVFNLGKIELKNEFVSSTDFEQNVIGRANEKEPFNTSLNDSMGSNDFSQKDCLLDLIDVKFTDTHLYSAMRYDYQTQTRFDKESEMLSQLDDDEVGNVKFLSFYFKQTSNKILKQQCDFHFHLERNLENELSHKSPDWSIYSKFSSISLFLDVQQYKLIRGILDQNIGEKILGSETQSRSTFIITNPSIETVLSGRLWKVISIRFDLENVGIELFADVNSSSSLAHMSFIRSSLTYEGYSDGSKLVDLVSNEIRITDCRSKLKPNLVLYKKSNDDESKNSSESRLQLEIHFRSNKISNRYSILFNNCRVISIIDWILQAKQFISSNAPPNEIDLVKRASNPNMGENIELPTEIKINLTNTDFVLIENRELSTSQAVILRMTAFLEYNERKIYRIIESCLQSVEVFSCQMNAIKETALSIIDPVMFNIQVKEKISGVEIKTANEFIMEITTDLLRLRVSYLDLNFFIRVLDSIQKQIKESQPKTPPNPESETTITNTQSNSSLNISELNLWMGNFCFCLIDDCNDIDIPLIDIQFNRFNLAQKFATMTFPQQQQQGSAEFALNIDYFNRLLSGWEPLVEPWLARINWKFKLTKNVFTLTSMDVLNLNVTNTFIQLITDVLTNWRADFNANLNQPKRHKLFHPYKLVNLTGQPIRFCPFQYTDTNSSLSSVIMARTSDHEHEINDDPTKSIESDLGTEWILVDDKSEKQFSFLSVDSPNGTKLNNSNMHSNHHYAQRSHNNQLRKLVQNRIRIKMDTWSEIRPLTVDKVGTYFREVYSEVTHQSKLNMTRLIFEISLSGNATKLIEIKSPVLIKNRLNYKLQCRIESCIQSVASILGPLILEIEIDQEVSIPVKYLPCQVWFRPIELIDTEFSDEPLNLGKLDQLGQIEYYQIKCKLAVPFLSEPTFTKGLDSVFYFFAKIKRHQFPTKQRKTVDILGYSINIEPAFALYNLLPIEFRYKFICNENKHKGVESKQKSAAKKSDNSINGKIDSYKLEYFSNINVSKSTELLLDLDNFRLQKSIEINPYKNLTNWSSNKSNNSSNNNNITEQDSTTPDISPNLSNRKLTILKRVNFYDEKNRPLFLIARITFKIGSGMLLNGSKNNNTDHHSDPIFNPCPIVVQISAIYCFFNLTGLPLVFRQYNCEESAGQLAEHELACSNQPLLFSFNEVDSPYACSMRMGKQCNDFKTIDWSAIKPRWCKPFGLDSGSSFRALHVVNNSIVQSASENEENEQNQQHNHQNKFDNHDSDSSYTPPSTSKGYLNHDWVYYIGIEIKPGKGLLKDTTFVYFSTRYYLVNKTNRDLLLSQYYFVKTEREKSIGVTWRTAQSCRTKLDLDKESQEMLIRRNKSSDKLETTKTWHDDMKNTVLLLKDSMCQFHWPRSDFDQLLSVRLRQDNNYNWSGSFKIDEVASFYINLRNCFNPADFFYLKVEIFLDGGTFYIIFSEKIDLPFPLRIENYCQVPVYVYQNQSLEETQSLTIKPRQTLNYAWDEPIGDKRLIVGVKGGTETSFDCSILNNDDTKYLYYENFIYIVFSDSATSTNIAAKNELSNSSQLVLTCVNNKIYLEEKQSGDRAQLWSLTLDGYLIHEGSSSPRELQTGLYSPLDMSNIYVLDIEDAAPRPNHLIQLTLRRPDMRRKNTQKWLFDKAGYLTCNVRNMCLQVIGEFKRHAKVVLGPLSDYQVKLNLVKSHAVMNVHKEQLRSGSGNILVKILTDGPTRVLKLTNIKNKSYLSINWEKPEFNHNHDISDHQLDQNHQNSPVKNSIEIYVNLTGGIGISLIQWFNQEYEELFYAYLKSFELNFDQNALEQKLLLGIQSIQVCNQLINAFRQNLLLIQTSANSLQANSNNRQVVNKELALKIDYLRKFRPNNETQIYIEHLVLSLSDLNLQIEERLLWKIIQFFGLSSLESRSEVNMSEEKFQRTQTGSSNLIHFNRDLVETGVDSLAANYYKSQINNLLVDSNAIKYSFNKLKITGIYMTLSVYKTPKMSVDLLRIKSSLGIPLIQFENARIECKAFILMNEHDTVACILNLISQHYRQELRSNAIRILGSVDFLGNPLGLMVDFKESFSNVLSNGQFTDFVFSITHGVANSLSKVSGSLSNTLSDELTMDERHRETREQIRSIYNQGSVDHFLGGALGFAVGIVGGALSMATQTYRGFNEAGVSGAFTGLGKGAVGTVSKPIVGVLDFANGIASAIRETSKVGGKLEVPRVRESRCCSTSGALLSPFSRSDANGQKILYQVNCSNLNEKYIALEQLKSSIGNETEQTLSLVTNQRVIFVKSLEFEFRTVYEVTYQKLKGMSVIEDKECTYLEMCIETDDNEKIFPRFKFENRESAKSLENKIRYAKADYDETLYTMHFYKDDEI